MEIQQPERINGKMVSKVKASAEEVNNCFKKTIGAVQAEAEIPGFRKGKAPINMIKKKYSSFIKERIRFELIQVLGEQMEKEKINLEGIGEPKLDFIEEPKENKECLMEISILNPPSIEISQYKDIEIEKSKYFFSPEIIDKYINEISQEQPVLDEKIGGVVEEDDLITIQYLFYKDDKKTENYETIRFPFQNSDSYDPEECDNIPYDIIKHLKGQKNAFEIDETTDIPENFKDKEIAGKEGKCFVKLIKIESYSTPEIDDDFATERGYKDLADFKDNIKKNMDRIADVKSKQELFGKVIEEIKMKSKFDVSDEYLDYFTDMEFENNKKSHLKNGTWNNFINNYESENDFKLEIKEGVLERVKDYLIENEITEKENYEYNEESARQYLKNYFMRMQDEKQIDELMKSMTNNKEQLAAIQNAIKKEWLVDFIFENQKIIKENEKELSLDDLNV